MFRKTINAVIKAVEAMPVIEGLPTPDDLALMADARPIEVAEAAGNITKRRILDVIGKLENPALSATPDTIRVETLIDDLLIQADENLRECIRDGISDVGVADLGKWADMMEAAADQLDHLLAIYEQRYADVRLLSANSDGKGAFVTELRSGMASFMAEYLGQLLEAEGAPNFAQVEAVHPKLGPLTFTIERRFGSSPAAQLAQAKARIAELEEQIRLERSV